MKIKQLKIINQDESTEIADIGADAVNIDYNDTNVKLKLDELSNNVDTNTTNISSEIATRANSVANLQSQINELASGSPLVASSTSEMTDTTKVYVNTSDGKWYYYNGSTWAMGGTYQSTAIEQEKLSQNINLSKVYSYQSPEAVQGFYDYYNGSMRLNTSVSHKCIKIDLLDNNCFLNYTVLTEPALAITFLKLKDNTFINLGSKTISNYPLTDAKELYINFFNNDQTIDNFTLTYSDLLRKNNITNLSLSKNNILNEFIIDKFNCYLQGGYFATVGGKITINRTSVSHKCTKIPINNDNAFLSFTGDSLPSSSISYGFLEKNDNSIISIGANPVTNLSLKDVRNLYLNFYLMTGYNFAQEFKITYNDESNIIHKYDDYVKDNYDFNNKTICYAGDSITRGYTSGTTQTNENFPKLFSEYVNATPLNISIGGALYTQGYNQVSTLLQQITNNTNKNVPFLVLAGGVNDCQLGVPLSEFKQAVINTLNYALQNYAGEIIVITPINNFKPFPQAITNLDYYSNILTEVAISLNNSRISVVQGHKFSFPNKSSNSDFISSMYGDGLHPTELGYRTAYLRGLIKALLK